MENSASVVRVDTQDTINVRLPDGCSRIIVTFKYLSTRFDLLDDKLWQIFVVGSEKPLESIKDGQGNPTCTLVRGGKYHIILTDDGGESVGQATTLDPHSSVSNPVSTDPSLVQSSTLLTTECLPRVQDASVEGRWKAYPRSAYNILLNVKGTSELSKFVKNRDFQARQVDSLPFNYNGNIIFELPPAEGEGLKGLGLRDMERVKDCYSWGRLMPMSARLVPRDLFQVQKALCNGSWECQNTNCDYFLRNAKKNCSSWLGRARSNRPPPPGKEISEGVQCGFCQFPPFCVSACSAKMYYLYPVCSLSEERRKSVSRLAIHMGFHNHSPRVVMSRSSVKMAKNVLRRCVSANPSSLPSRIRNVATGELLKLFNSTILEELLDIEATEIWDSLKVLSTPQRFSSLLRSIRKDELKRFQLDSIRQMRNNVRFLFIQRYLFPGQASAGERCHVFKMSTKGPGSGINLLRQMSPGNPLEGTWVSFDMMHRITTEWLTFSAHVYDHNYRALCTIFTCELRSEDALSLEKAWRLMLEVAEENGLTSVNIYGFMADNAQAGWTSVRNVFFGGEPRRDRERSDAFHLYQSLTKHSSGGIPPEKQGQHLVLWERLRNAPTYLDAYRISQEIQDWWKSGNCVSGKLRMLQGWLAWWIVRWRQWGNYIRHTLTTQEAALMPNTTGSESVHSSMRKCSSEGRIGLVEACETDQNRSAGQIAAYTSYLEGQLRGRGPTVFELAFRSAVMTGSEQACIDASNALLNASSKYDLYRTTPLHGDLKTKSSKRKGSASGTIGLDDSHRPDTVLLTTPVHFKVKRRNIAEEFSPGRSSKDIPTVSPRDPRIVILDSDTFDDVEVLVTPPWRSCGGHAPVLGDPVIAQGVPEINVPFHTWHLRRTSHLGRGPDCRGRLQSSDAHRDKCKDKIKKSGLQDKRGVVGIAFQGTRDHQGVAYRHMFWFCPNNVCHRSGGRRNMTSVPPVPDIMPVLLGTNLSAEEIAFFSLKGIRLPGVNPLPIQVPGRPSLLEIRVNVACFVERLPENNLEFRSPTREGRQVRSRLSQSSGHQKRIESAQKLHLAIVIDFVIETGNAAGKQFCVRSGESGYNYWVQICRFPCCSCDDFYKRHTSRLPYMPCKHLYWVYKNVGGLCLESSAVVDQPVLTLREVYDITGKLH